MILVTSYEFPDLDGTACSVGCAEELQSRGIAASAGIFGQTDAETNFVLNTFNLPAPPSAHPLIAADPDVILVDASDRASISASIRSDRVVEIIDHRAVNEQEQFPNAKVHIELVGSCATLIAERFAKRSQRPTNGTAALLYSAIVSNTVNFKNNVTTKRDHAMAKWLQEQLTIPNGFIHNMFIAKSDIADSLEEFLEHECATYRFGSTTSSIFQLELVEAHAFVVRHYDRIRAVLERLKSEHVLDLVLLTAIDIEEGSNTFVVLDTATAAIIEKIVDVIFNEQFIAQRPGIIMRKELFPLIKEYIRHHPIAHS